MLNFLFSPNSSEVMGSGSEVVDLDSLQQLIGYHRINIFLGAICASLSLILAFFLLTSRHFRKNSQVGYS